MLGSFLFFSRDFLEIKKLFRKGKNEEKEMGRMLSVGKIGGLQLNFQGNLENEPPLRFRKDLPTKKMQLHLFL